MCAIATAVSRHDVRESVIEPLSLRVHAVTEGRAVSGGVNEDTSYCSSRDIEHVVDRTAAVWKSSIIAGEETQT